MIRTASITAIVSVLAVAATTAGAAPAPKASLHSAASEVALSDQSGSAARLSDRAFIYSMLPEAASPMLDGVPTAWELKSADDGRILLETDGKRFTAVPTSDGDVCVTTSVKEAPTFATCYQTLPKSGAALSFVTSTGTVPDSVIGLVAADVSSVSIKLSSGERVDVDTPNGALWWESKDLGTRIVSVENRRAGVSHAEAAPAIGDLDRY